MTAKKAIFSSLLMVGLLGASLFAQSSSAGRYDTTIQTSVTHKLTDNQKFHNVKSSVDDGIVTLTGTVDLYQDKLDAAKAAKSKRTCRASGTLFKLLDPRVPKSKCTSRWSRRFTNNGLAWMTARFTSLL